jgi:Mce-associated membrane protein
MAADADAPAGEMSNADNAAQPSTEAGRSPAEDSASASDQRDNAQDAADDETPAADSDSPDDAEKDEDAKQRTSPVRLATLVGLVAVLALGGVVGWLGFKDYQWRQERELREMYLRVGRQVAINLTTIDWQSVNNDIQRILDSATGPFYDDFSKRSQPFIDVVKKVQSKSVGSVTEAGLESVSGNEARVLVAVSVKTSTLGATDQAPRAWRMRIDVQKVDDGAKVSNVLFVPS